MIYVVLNKPKFSLSYWKRSNLKQWYQLFGTSSHSMWCLRQV